MTRAMRYAALTAATLLAGCVQAPGAGAFPPLPGPRPDVEVVSVSTDIASPSRPVFYSRDASDPNRLLAYDWDGNLRGALTVKPTEPYGVYPSPDGTFVLLMYAHVLSGGKSVGMLSRGVWAGDNAHLCAFLNRLGGPGAPRQRKVSANEWEGIDTPGTLFYESVGGSSRRLLDYGQFGPHGAPAVLACSARSDRAVIGQSFTASMSAIQVVRLSDGRVIGQGPARPATGADGVVVSGDGTLLGQGSTGGVESPGAINGFAVFHLPDNRVVARITGGGIEAFSADDTRALIVEDVGGSNEQRRYQLIDLTTSRSLWSAVLSPGTVLTRPGSGDFLVGTRTYVPNPDPTKGATPFEDLWLITSDGSARVLLKHASPIA